MENCKEIEESLFDYLEENLNIEDIKLIEVHLKKCSSCQETYKENLHLLKMLKKLPINKPSSKLQSGFYSMLEDKIIPIKKSYKSFIPYIYVAASICLILVGFFYGKQKSDKLNEQQLVILEIENKEYKKEASLAMIESKSVSKRISGIRYFEGFNELDEDLIEALLERVKYDANVNVKLAAIDMLYKYPNNMMVRDRLLEIINDPQDIIVQINIIKLLMNFNKKYIEKPVKKLLENEDVPENIKVQLRRKISSFAN